MNRRRPFKRPLRPKFDVPGDIDPRAVRQSLGYTQERFANLIGVSIRVVQAWSARSGFVLLVAKSVRTTRCGKPATAVRPAQPACCWVMVQRDPWVVFDVMTGQLSPDRG